MIIGKKVSQVNVFAGSPWQAASIIGILTAAYIDVCVRDEGAEIKLLVPSEHYSAALRLIGSRGI